jgi:CheY-like chemotaxis protein
MTDTAPARILGSSIARQMLRLVAWATRIGTGNGGSVRAASGRATTVYDIQSEGQSSQVSLTEASRAEVRGRLATIERALLTVRPGALDDVHALEARRAAHKLAGSLDILGLTRAGELAGELESLFESGNAQGSRAHGALADLRSEVERGLMGIPVAEPAEPVVPARGAAARILLAEDDDIMARMIEAALSRQGYEVIRTVDGAEAVSLAAGRPFDLILLDLQMPVMDGADACLALRKHPHLTDVPILLLTAQNNQQQVRERSLPGVTDYLIKPFGLADLRSRVQHWLHADGGRAQER